MKNADKINEAGLQCFVFNDNTVRTMIAENGETWWVLKDVCDVLGIQNATDVAKRLDDDERARLNLGQYGYRPKSGLGQDDEAWFINESGLYSVVIRSDKPEAKKFRRWVTHDVLPSIRKQGFYSVDDRKLLETGKLEPVALELQKLNALLKKVDSDALREKLVNTVGTYVCNSVAKALGYKITNTPQSVTEIVEGIFVLAEAEPENYVWRNLTIAEWRMFHKELTGLSNQQIGLALAHLDIGWFPVRYDGNRSPRRVRTLPLRRYA